MKDGGPAFPVGFDLAERGMSLRDYFAATAPKEILWDFVVRGYEVRPTPLMEDCGPGRDRVCVNEKEVSRFDNERAVAKRKQWPWVWADAMLAEREKK